MQKVLRHSYNEEFRKQIAAQFGFNNLQDY